jgi:hypothetical protein
LLKWQAVRSWWHATAARGQLLRQKKDGSLRGISYNTTNLENIVKTGFSESDCQDVDWIELVTIGFGGGLF